MRHPITRDAMAVALLLGAMACSASGQMTGVEADRYIQGFNAPLDVATMKRVLTADRAALAAHVGNADENLASYAVREARRRRDAGLAPALLARVSDARSARLSVAAAAALGDTGGDPGHKALRRALRDARVVVRVAAALVVGRGGDRAAIPALREGLGVAPADSQVASAALLASFRDLRSVPRIVRLVDEMDTVHRRYLCNPLGRLGGAASHRKLLAMLAGKDYSGTRARAALALGVRGNRRAVPGLVKALDDPGADVRYAAAKALGVIGDPSAVPALRRAAARPLPAAKNAPSMERRSRAAASEAIAYLTTRRGAAPAHAPADLSPWTDTESRVRRPPAR